jgi:hypothetical protein
MRGHWLTSIKNGQKGRDVSRRKILPLVDKDRTALLELLYELGLSSRKILGC